MVHSSDSEIKQELALLLKLFFGISAQSDIPIKYIYVSDFL